MLAELKFCMTSWFFMYPPPPHVVRCGFLTNPPSPPVRPRGLRMTPNTLGLNTQIKEKSVKRGIRNY